jgi:hypothetical protein
MAVFVIFVIDVKLIFGGGLGCTAVGSVQLRSYARTYVVLNL